MGNPRRSTTTCAESLVREPHILWSILGPRPKRNKLSTWQYRHKPRARVSEPIPQKERAYPSCISAADRTVIAEKITAGWADGNAVDHTFATVWDQGVMLAGRRSWWRIAADIQDQSARPIVPTGRGSKTPREKPVLIATGPMQVWSCYADIVIMPMLPSVARWLAVVVAERSA